MRAYFHEILETIGRSMESMDAGVFERLLDDCQRTLARGERSLSAAWGRTCPCATSLWAP